MKTRLASLLFCILLSSAAFANDLPKAKFDPNIKDYSRKDLEDCNFAGKNLSGFKFIGADLDEANFENANLTDADFTGAEIEKANFKNAILTNTNFTNADLEEANLTGAKIEKTVFKNTELEYAIWINGKTCGAGSVGSCW